MKLETAQEIGNRLIESMRPYCHRIELAGSVRREKPECSDIEIVAIPKWETHEMPDGLFGTKTESVNMLYEYLMDSEIRWIYRRHDEVFDATPKPDAKMMKGLLPCGAQLDLFLACPENWGAIFMIRTGDSFFSQAMVTRGLKIGKRFVDGYMTVRGERIETREEIEVFEKLGVRYIEPRERNGESAMKIVGFGNS